MHLWKTCKCDSCKVRRNKLRTRQRDKAAWAKVVKDQESARIVRENQDRWLKRMGIEYVE